MKLLFKQRLFSWFDSSDIYDEAGNTVYTVQGRLAWGHKLEISDAAGRYLGMVKEEVLTFLPRFDLYVGKTASARSRRSSPSSSRPSAWTATAGRSRGTSGSGTIRSWTAPGRS